MSYPAPPPPPSKPTSGAPPVGTTHSPAHEEGILAATFGDPAAGDPMTLAERMADCDGCLTAALRTLDELLALHATRHPAPGAADPPAAIARLEALLDDAMVLRGERADGPSTPPAGDTGAGEKAERDRRAVPMGSGRR